MYSILSRNARTACSKQARKMGRALEHLANTAMAGIGNTIGGVLGEQIGFGLGELTGYNKAQANAQLEQQQKLTDIQTKANQQQASYANRLNKEMFDYTAEYNSYENQMARMKAAGLNTALMYGQSGAGGSTGTAGSQSGGSAGSGQASDEASRRMAQIQAHGMGLLNSKLMAEIRNIEADTKQKEATATKTAGVDTKAAESQIAKMGEEMKLIGEQTKSESVKRRGQELTNDWQELQTALSEATLDSQIKTIQLTAYKLQNESNKILQEIDGLQIDNNIKEQTKKNVIKQQELAVQESISRILMNKSVANLNQEQANAIATQLTLKAKEIKASEDSNQVKREQIEAELAKLPIIQQEGRRDRTMNYITKIINSAIEIIPL